MVSTLLSGIIRLYQRSLSPFVGGECRFYPTCSDYALEALQYLPWRRAVLSIMKRLLSCHPYHSGGFDPVKWKANP